MRAGGGGLEKAGSTVTNLGKVSGREGLNNNS